MPTALDGSGGGTAPRAGVAGPAGLGKEHGRTGIGQRRHEATDCRPNHGGWPFAAASGGGLDTYAEWQVGM